MFVVGIGPGNPLDRTRRAEQSIAQSDAVAGYTPYVDSIADLTEGKEIVTSGMRKEAERCRRALDLAAQGRTVSLISSGDAGVYGMAGLALEIIEAEGYEVEIEIVPGVTAASAAGALLGAPLMLDFAVISLSDLLVPWETIRRRLRALAEADLVVALYNPRSQKRVEQLVEAVAILKTKRLGSTPVGVVTGASSEDERIVVTSLDHLLEQEIGMRSIVVVGNSSSRLCGEWFITPRGYDV